MHKVVVVDNGLVPPVPAGRRLPTAFPGSALKAGVVEVVAGPGRYNVALSDGTKIQVRSNVLLKPGDQVQVLATDQTRGIPEPESQEAVEVQEGGSILSALIPLAFGGPKASAKLEVEVEHRPNEPFKKGRPAIYFVFIVSTEGQGEVQWGIHLHGRQVALQVYAPQVGRKTEMGKLVAEVQKALTDRGFVMSGQVIFSGHPLRLPSGARLNLRG